MSTTLGALDGHVGVYAAGIAAGERLIGLQIEDERGSKSLTRVRLTTRQALAIALELLDRATDEPMLASVKNCLRGGGFVP